MSDSGDPPKESRTLILCFDGTSGEYDGDNTNVVKFYALLKKDDFSEQLCYYQPGIGTWFNPGVASPIFHWGAKVLDQSFAWYLDAHVIEGYKFVMQNYRVGDKICIFGFSRGSYTGRALAGALYKVGLLPRDNEQQIPFAYKLYKREDPEGIALCAGFKQTFCQSVKVEFVGVWDTVSSVGVVMGRTLPFTNSNKAIKTFRHALSLDERRSKFRPNTYHRPAPDSAGAALDPEHASPVLAHKGTSPTSTTSGDQKLVPRKCPGFTSRFLKHPSKAFLDAFEEEEGDDTDVMEVWFSGCHSDVGGGAVLDSVPHSISNISLRWMVGEVMKAQCGIQFEESALKRASIPYFTFPGTPPIEGAPDRAAMDAADALEPIHDELKKNVLWWLLEIIPLTYSCQDANGVWHREFNFNLGRGRVIQDPNPSFHATVKHRVNKMKYKPKAGWTAGTERYIH